MKRIPPGWYKVSLPLAAVVIAFSFALWSCSSDQSDNATAPETGQAPVVLSAFNPQVASVMDVQDRYTPDLMAIPGVVGTATSADESGNLIIKVYTEELLPQGKLPESLDGVRVVQHVSGRIVAKKGPPPMDGNGDDPRAKQTPPVKMGTSGGWRYDLANGYCCSGTLGCLVQKGGTKYVLSNYHVLYSDTSPGGNGRVAQPGDPVIQPGMIDIGCNANNAQDIATLVSGGASLPDPGNPNAVDAGIAAVIPGMVDETGAILSVGTISAQTVGAFVGQDVKKMGRTTGLARGTVDGINGTFTIGYEDECAGDFDFDQTFYGQIVIGNRRCKFLDGGDSGSLMVEDVDTDPRAVGLLYAGSYICNKNSIAIANPIGDVLAEYGATMVGN